MSDEVKGFEPIKDEPVADNSGLFDDDDDYTPQTPPVNQQPNVNYQQPNYETGSVQPQPQPQASYMDGAVYQQQSAYQGPQVSKLDVQTQNSSNKAWFIVKCIICALFPGLGIICAIVSACKHHKFNSKIYTLITVIAMVLQFILGCAIGGISAIKSVNDDWSDYDSSYVDEDSDYDDDNSDLILDETTTEAATETTTQADSNVTVLSVDWKDYTCYVEGQKITFPISCKDFCSLTGYTFDDSDDATSTIKANQYTTSIPMVKGDKEIYVRFVNNTDKQTTLSGCTIGGIGVDDFYKSDCVFVGGFKLGDKATVDDIKAKLGEPERVYDGTDDYHTVTYEDQIYNRFEITVSGGKIAQIDLEKFV